MPKISDKCKNTNFYPPLIKQYKSAQLARVGRQVEENKAQANYRKTAIDEICILNFR